MLAHLFALALAAPVAPVPTPGAPFAAGERARWRERLSWPPECETAHAAALRLLELDDARLRVLALDGRRSLVVVACESGAYQDTLLFYLWDESRAEARSTRLRLPSYAPDDEQDEGGWKPVELEQGHGEAQLDAARRTLVLLTRARGLGDCGTRAEYRVQGARLALVELRGRACDGDPEQAPPPEKWPRVYPK